MISRLARPSGVGLRMLRVLPVLLVVLALGSVQDSRVPCPPGMTCAAPTFTGEEIATMPESCFDRIAEEARRLRHRGFNAAMFAVRTTSGDGIDGPVSPSVLARRMARAAAIVRSASLEPLIRLEPSDDGRCDSDADRWFVRAYADAVATYRRDAPRLSSRIYCGETRAGTEPETADSPATFTPASLRPIEADTVAAARADRAGTLADFTRRGRLVATAAATVAGFVAPGAEESDWIRNGDFARGWDGWETDGRLALAAAESRPDACHGLTATLAPGATISQHLPFATRARMPAGAATLTLRVVPAATDREMLVGLGRDERVVPVRSGLASVATTYPFGAAHDDDPVLQIRVPPTAAGPIDLRSVRLVEPAPAGFHPLRPASLGALLAGASAGVREAASDPLALTSLNRVALANVLSAARITTSGETFVRVARQVPEEQDESGPSIMAHPGSIRPTVLRWRLPAAACPRHLSARVGLASACRGMSDGVDFAVEAGDRALRVHVAESGEAQDVALDLDPPGATSVPPVDLVLTTSSGAAHDARCDWALWMDPEVSCAGNRAASRDGHVAPAVARVLDLGALGEGEPFRTRWDEVNLWKLYTYFGPVRAVQRPSTDPPGWLHERLPWATHVRVLGAVGGNTCRHIRADCEAGQGSVEHPFDGRCWEGADGRAARYEILRDDGPEDVLDASTWRAGIDDLLASGMLPHLNVSAVPCALADGHDYRTYHWNQRPVRRSEDWRRYVEYVATQIASEPSWRDWRFSITNEPNCLWIDGARDRGHVVEHVGFAGTATEYASHFVATLQALRRVLPGLRVQLGNFTIGGKYALEDNLPEYLGLLGEDLASAGVSAGELSALSFSLYETPQHGLADLGPYKFGRLRRWIGDRSPFHGIPWKLDEVEIHPLVAKAFEERTHVDLDGTRWAATWHADLLALAVREGVVSVAPWLNRLFGDENLTQPFPKFWTYALAALAAGDIGPRSPDFLHPGALVPRSSERRRNHLVAVHPAATDPDGVGYLVTREPDAGTWWLLAWRHGDLPVADDAGAEPVVALRVVVPPVLARARAESVAIGADAGGEGWRIEPWDTTPLRARALTVADAQLVIELAPESIHLIRMANPDAVRSAP